MSNEEFYSDPTVNCRDRLTHRQTGRAVVRHDWMTNLEWEQAKERFRQEMTAQTSDFEAVLAMAGPLVRRV